MVIVAAVDRSEHAKRVVSEAETLAEAFDDTVHVLHVMSRSEFRDLQRENFEESGEAVDMERVRELAAEHAAQAAEDVDRPHEVVGRMGDAKTDVLAYVDNQDARYIVIGGRKRSPAGKALFGSVAQSILLNADHPVVTVIRQG